MIVQIKQDSPKFYDLRSITRNKQNYETRFNCTNRERMGSNPPRREKKNRRERREEQRQQRFDGIDGALPLP